MVFFISVFLSTHREARQKNNRHLHQGRSFAVGDIILGAFALHIRRASTRTSPLTTFALSRGLVGIIAVLADEFPMLNYNIHALCQKSNSVCAAICAAPCYFW